MARLIVKGTDTTVEVGPGQAVKIGRDPTNEIPLPDEGKASRRHCQILGVPSGDTVSYEVTDLGATNKTRVNGKAIDRKVLSHGDVIAVGTVEIEFEDESEMAQMRSAGAEGVCFIEWANKERRGEKVWLRGSRTTFGRRDSSTVPLDDRMASGHHAEIVKDLNGYTVRDLGSTNGTLVNGEPITEAPLSHGTRIRIGNSRFVFKDPSMKDIEVELSQFDEDEGWGMMGDIDLSRARRSYGGIIVAVLMLAALAGGGYLLMQESGKGAAVDADSGPVNLVANGGFDGESYSWNVEGDPTGELGSMSLTKSRGGNALRVRHKGDEGTPAITVLYDERFKPLASKPMRVRASIRPSGDPAAQFVAVWRRRGQKKAGKTGITQTVPLNDGSTVDTLLVKPLWADDVAIGVYLPSGASAVIDDVFVAFDEEATQTVHDLGAPGDVRAALRPDAGSADLVRNLTVLFAAAGPVARAKDGGIYEHFVVSEANGGTVKGMLHGGGDEGLATTVTWSAGGQDGLDVRVEVKGATEAGLRFGLPREHIADGVDVLATDGPATMAAEAGGETKGIRKLLAGSPSPEDSRPATLIVVSPLQGTDTVRALLRDGKDASLLDAVLFAQGSSAGFHFVTDAKPLEAQAQQELDAALALLRTDPGGGITALRAFATEYPFQESMRDRAMTAAAKREETAWKDVNALQEALQKFSIFRSNATLHDLETRANQLGAEFPMGSDPTKAGPLPRRVAELRKEAEIARRDFLTRGVEKNVQRLERTANMLKEIEGFEPMAALYYEVIVQKLAPLSADPTFKSQLDKARGELEALRTKHADAIPPLPR